MGKFKVGDKVIGNELANREYSITRKGYVGTVTSTCGSEIKLDNGCVVDEKYFDLYQAPNQIHITTKGTDTIAVLTDGKKEIRRAIAKCSPSDTFDFEVGAKLAFTRLIGGDKQQVKEVERAAKVGEYIKLVSAGFSHNKIGDVLLVSEIYGSGGASVKSENQPRDTGDENDYLWNYCKNEYVVLENYTPSESKSFDLSTVSNEDLIAELQRRLVG